jgi:hypothetical protein
MLTDCPAKRCVEVVDLGVQPRQVLDATRPHKHLFGPMALGQREEVVVVALAHRPRVTNGRESLGRVRADRFEHPHPAPRVRITAADEEVLGDQAVERVEPGVGDRLGRLHGRAAGEHREAREAMLLAIAEQIVAPVDGRTQRPLAGRRVSGAGAQRAERGVETVADLGR